jgi:hypothetical protein
MSRGPHTFKQTDITRAIRATVAAGVEVARVEVSQDGRIVVVLGKAGPVSEPNPWDDAMKELQQ